MVTVKVRDNKVLSRSLNRFARDIDDFRPAMRKAGEKVVPLLQEQPPRKGWKPLAPGYRRWKRRAYPGKPIGILTGAMVAAFRAVANRLSLTVTNGKEYFRWFHGGTKRQPARPFDFKIIAPIVQESIREFVIEKAIAAGLRKRR